MNAIKKRDWKSWKKSIVIFLSLLIIMSFFPITSAWAEGEQNYEGANIVTSLEVSPTDISHTQDFHVSVKFKGQNTNPNGNDYIYPGKKIVIPIKSDGVARAALNSTIPKIDNTKITVDSNQIVIEFTDGITNQYDIEGFLRLTMRGENAVEGSTHSLTIGNTHTVNITNTKGGTVGVFAGKTGMMYGAYKPGYVTWFLRGNINGDAWPGGPLKIHDKLGEGQRLDGTGIEIGLYWGGQLNSTYSKNITALMNS